MCVCTYVCKSVATGGARTLWICILWQFRKLNRQTRTHTHTHTYLHTYIHTIILKNPPASDYPQDEACLLSNRVGGSLGLLFFCVFFVFALLVCVLCYVGVLFAAVPVILLYSVRWSMYLCTHMYISWNCGEKSAQMTVNTWKSCCGAREPPILNCAGPTMCTHQALPAWHPKYQDPRLGKHKASGMVGLQSSGTLSVKACDGKTLSAHLRTCLRRKDLSKVNAWAAQTTLSKLDPNWR